MSMVPNQTRIIYNELSILHSLGNLPHNLNLRERLALNRTTWLSFKMEMQ